MGILLLDGSDVPAGLPATAYAQLLEQLLPQGRLWRFLDSLTSALLLGSADELARVDARAYDMLRESDPRLAVELLPEYERELDLDGSGPIAERQANVVARLIRRQGFKPADFREALAPLLAQDAADVVVIERSSAFAASIGDPREIYRFFIYRDPTLPGTYFLASAQVMVDEMKPSHTIGTVIESIDALYDDPFTLYDRDILGA